MMHSRKPLAALIALGAALAVPTAFAQDATTTAPPHDPATQTNPAPPPAPSASQQPLTWADLDVDGSGTLSRTEAGNLPSLAQVFDQADADSDGELTQDEYKGFVARSNAAQPAANGGND